MDNLGNIFTLPSMRSITTSIPVWPYVFCLCLSVCLSVCPFSCLNTVRLNFTKFFAHVTCDRVSVLLCRCVLSVFGWLHVFTYWSKWARIKDDVMHRRVRQVAAPRRSYCLQLQAYWSLQGFWQPTVLSFFWRLLLWLPLEFSTLPGVGTAFGLFVFLGNVFGGPQTNCDKSEKIAVKTACCALGRQKNVLTSLH